MLALPVQGSKSRTKTNDREKRTSSFASALITPPRPLPSLSKQTPSPPSFVILYNKCPSHPHPIALRCVDRTGNVSLRPHVPPLRPFYFFNHVECIFFFFFFFFRTPGSGIDADAKSHTYHSIVFISNSNFCASFILILISLSLSVLFSDFSGFRSLTLRLTPSSINAHLLTD